MLQNKLLCIFSVNEKLRSNLGDIYRGYTSIHISFYPYHQLSTKSKITNKENDITFIHPPFAPAKKRPNIVFVFARFRDTRSFEYISELSRDTFPHRCIGGISLDFCAFFAEKASFPPFPPSNKVDIMHLRPRDGNYPRLSHDSSSARSPCSLWSLGNRGSPKAVFRRQEWTN